MSSTCRLQGMNLVAVYQDDLTGKTLKRKRLRAALEHMKQSGATYRRLHPARH